LREGLAWPADLAQVESVHVGWEATQFLMQGIAVGADQALIGMPGCEEMFEPGTFEAHGLVEVP
jgi:hypothetical protein